MRYRLAHSRDIKKHRWNNVCPSCGQRKFSPYIDTMTNKPIAEKECGRCCRERSCAYHYPPREWFKDNPPERREWLPREQYTELMRQRRKEARVASPLPRSLACNLSGGETKRYCERMNDLCIRTRSDRNHLAQWLCTQFPAERVAEVLARYRTGSTRDGRIIYWQIDEQGQVRTGKVMVYDPLTGHRVKRKEIPSIESRGEMNLGCLRPLRAANFVCGDERFISPKECYNVTYGGGAPVSWVHSMKIDGIRFGEMLVPQCLFGLHLLNDNDAAELQVNVALPRLNVAGRQVNRNRRLLVNAPLARLKVDGYGVEVNDNQSSLALQAAISPLVMLVESEKTALLMSLLCPDGVWLATGGKQNLKEAMLWPLVGMEVSLYPDADALADWYTRAMQLNRTLGTRLHIPTWYYDLMNHPEAKAAGWDLADVIISRGGILPPY